MPHESPSTPEPIPGAPRNRSFGRVAAALILLGLAVAAISLGHPHQRLQSLLEILRNLGPWAPVLFVVAYVLACILFLPGSALTLGAGALFGVVQGFICVSIGSTLGATASFLIGRHLARAAVERRITSQPAFKAIDEAVAREGWKIVLLTRLSPLFPFNLLNYGFGVTRVSLGHYVSASWLGMIPGTLLYVYLGSVAGGLVGTQQGRSPAEWALFAVGLLATVAVTILITRLARKALQQRLHSNPP